MKYIGYAYIALAVVIVMFVFVLVGCLIVLGLDFKRIRKIPLEEALKNVE